MDKLNKTKIKGENFHENTTFEFTGTGMIIYVSLNISRDISKYLSPNLIFRGEKMLTYRLKYHLESKYIHKGNIQKIHDYLLKNAMCNIREAKIKVLEGEVKMITNEMY